MNQRCVELPFADGLLCCVPDNDDLLSTFVLREQLDWFEDEIRFVRRLVRPGDHVIDIGANYGTYTLSLGRAVGPDGRVHAFEPASAPLAMLRRSVGINDLADRVQIHPVGLSDHPGAAEMGISANPELNSLTGAKESVERVQLSTLDSMLPAFSRPISFIKMDAEGEEERILQAADGFLAAHNPIIMFEMRHGHEINEGLCEAFLRRGYLIHRLIPALDALAPIPLGEALDGYQLNAFAIKPDREAALRERGMLLPLRLPPLATMPPVPVRAAIAELRAQSWANCAGAWQPDPSLPGWDEHRRAVALAWTAGRENGGLSAADRLACLRHALVSARSAARAHTTGSRLFTLARIALDLGWRGEAVTALQQVVGSIAAGNDPTPAFSEPFLLPMRCHESLTGIGLRELVSLAALEGYAWKSAFSAYFTGTQQMQLYERIAADGHCQPRSRRALQLLRSRNRMRFVTA